MLIDFWIARPHLLGFEAEEIDDHDVARCAREIAAIAVEADVFFQPGAAAKAEMLGFLGCYDEAGADELHAAIAKSEIRLQFGDARNINTNSQIGIDDSTRLHKRQLWFVRVKIAFRSDFAQDARMTSGRCHCHGDAHRRRIFGGFRPRVIGNGHQQGNRRLGLEVPLQGAALEYLGDGIGGDQAEALEACAFGGKILRRPVPPVHDEIGAIIHFLVGCPQRLGILVAGARADVLATDEWRITDNVIGFRPLRAARIFVVALGIDAIMLQHRVLLLDILEFAQDGFNGWLALGAEVPAQIADPQHQLGDGRGARIDLKSEELVRIDREAFKPQRLLSAQLLDEVEHLAFQPLQQFQRDIEKVSGAAGGIENLEIAEPVVKQFDPLQRLFRVDFERALHIVPFLAQGLDHRGNDQALHIGARRIVSPEPGALRWVQRLFQQRAEDRGIDLFPILARRFLQLADILAPHGKDPGLGEQIAIEALYLGFDGDRKAARVHLLPQFGDHRHEGLRVLGATLEKRRERSLGDEFGVFGEHGEQAAHEEQRHLFRRMAARFQPLRHRRQPFGNLARRLGRPFGGVE